MNIGGTDLYELDFCLFAGYFFPCIVFIFSSLCDLLVHINTCYHADPCIFFVSRFFSGP